MRWLDGITDSMHVSLSELWELVKQKTAYEMYICDWNSDVCSSDLGQEEKGTTEDEMAGWHH